MIKHIWFDFSDTIASIHRERHDKLRHDTYATVTGKPVTPELIEEFENLSISTGYTKNNSGFFKSLGKPANFWSDQVNLIHPSELYRLADDNIPEVLSKLSQIVPISIFSNINLEKILPVFHVDSKLFTHVLSGGMVGRPKPALDGFYKIIEISNLSPDEILYVGDSVEKDILPAKKVGLKTAIIWGESKEADYVFKDFNDILKIFD